jgi:hypothetical protein
MPWQEVSRMQLLRRGKPAALGEGTQRQRLKIRLVLMPPKAKLLLMM